MIPGIRQKGMPPAGKISAQHGVVLIEALIAVLIFSMGVLALVGLQAAMVKNTSDARYRTEAAMIAQERVGLIWSDAANLNTYLEATPVDISTRLPNGTRTTIQTAAGEFMVTIQWTPPTDSAAPETHTYAMLARVAGS